MGAQLIPSAAAEPAAIVQADGDQQLVDLWLHGKSVHTRRYYRRVAADFLAAIAPRGLREVVLGDVQRWADAQEGMDSRRTVRLVAVKSLLTFGNRVGYLRFNVGAPVKPAPVKNTLAERILEEAAVHRLIALEDDPRNRLLLRLLYATGLRVSEACGLRRRDLVDRSRGQGQLTAFGKGGKTRAVLVPASVWRALRAAIPAEGDPDQPVFASRRDGTALSTRRAQKIVEAAARRAGLAQAVSPHWLRHAHASHALDRGAKISLVQATLGHASVATTGKYLHARPDESSGDYLAV
jgi:site-specific recombinase XerD